MPLDPFLLLVVPTFLLAGFVKGVTGLGLPTVSLGLLTLAMPPAEAVALSIVPAFATNAWQLAAGPRLWATLGRLWPMMAAVALGTAAAAGAMGRAGGDAALLGLGAALVAYAALGLGAPRLRVRPADERWLGPSMGLATGLVTGATGVSVVPAAPYLAALGLPKEELVQALGLTFTTSMLTLAAALAGGGALGGEAALRSLGALAPALAGLAVGGWVRGRVSEALFRRCLHLGLLALGLHLAARGLL